MELAIPLVALGGMYIASKKKDEPKYAKRTFENMGKPENYLLTQMCL